MRFIVAGDYGGVLGLKDAWNAIVVHYTYCVRGELGWGCVVVRCYLYL